MKRKSNLVGKHYLVCLGFGLGSLIRCWEVLNKLLLLPVPQFLWHCGSNSAVLLGIELRRWRLAPFWIDLLSALIAAKFAYMDKYKQKSQLNPALYNLRLFLLCYSSWKMLIMQLTFIILGRCKFPQQVCLHMYICFCSLQKMICDLYQYTGWEP